jgi:hypothetical protein
LPGILSTSGHWDNQDLPFLYPPSIVAFATFRRQRHDSVAVVIRLRVRGDLEALSYEPLAVR